MADLQSRLVCCLSAVFPSLPREDIPRARSSTVEAWDSLATATLMALVEEEFGIQVAPEDLVRFVSFQEILAHLQSRKTVDSKQ
jgi:acyl carrier protein